MTDQTLDTTTPSQLAGSLADDATSPLQTVLNLEQILSSARRAERTVPLCIDGEARREYEDAIRELSTLVDAEGNVLERDGEVTLADESRAVELNEQASEALKRVRAKTLPFRVRAMDSDAFEAWDESHKDAQGKIKDQRKYENELMAKSLISPEADVDGVARLRSVLGQAQVVALFNGAYFVNTQDGLDVPFSPRFLRAPKPKEQ